MPYAVLYLYLSYSLQILYDVAVIVAYMLNDTSAWLGKSSGK